jgi:hypothetical protein
MSREGCWWLPVGDGPAQEIGRESEGKEKGPAGLRPKEKRERGKRAGGDDRANRPNWRERGRKEFLLFLNCFSKSNLKNDF